MTARDVIARVVQDFVDPQKGDWVSDAYRSAADDIVVALTAAGYKLIGPGELDQETIERCAVIVADASADIPRHKLSAALRALQSQEAGDEG